MVNSFPMELYATVLMMSGVVPRRFSVAQKHTFDKLVDAYRLFLSDSELLSYQKWFVSCFNQRLSFRQ